MILKRLRIETSERHAALEERLPLVSPHLSRSDYGTLMKGFLGYYAPLETRLLALQVWSLLAFDFAERRKVPQLEKDVLALGNSADELSQLPRCADLPALATIPQVLGCLYVIEGSTLGGQIITRHLRANLGITPETGGSFFAGYGPQTGAKWQAFGAMITVAALQFRQEDEIVASANRTFETLDRWLFPTSLR